MTSFSRYKLKGFAKEISTMLHFLVCCLCVIFLWKSDAILFTFREISSTEDLSLNLKREKVGNAHQSIAQANQEIEPKNVAKILQPPQTRPATYGKIQTSMQGNSLVIYFAKENLPQNFNFAFCQHPCDDQPTTYKHGRQEEDFSYQEG